MESTRLLLCPFILAAWIASAQESFPPATWTDAPDPIASSYALPGGTLRVFSGQYPQSLNAYLDNNVLSVDIFGSMYESLLGTDPLTAEYTPALAARWTISEDRRTFTFELDPTARWSDGRPVTPADVTWTFAAVMNPTNLTGPHKVALEVFEPPLIVGSNTVRFTAREVHWRNLGAVGGLNILPRHVFEGQDFNKINFVFPVVSGPYRVGELAEGVSIRMDRRTDWWAQSFARNRNTLNFAHVLHRFYGERENAFEAFKQGQIDVFPVYTSRLWVNETSSEPFHKNWIVRQSIHNYNPIGFQGFAMNLRRRLFADLRVRRALAHLLARETMNRTLMYNQYFLHRSYVEDLYTETTPCPNPLIPYDKEAARALLAEAGWQANPATGVLEKDGTPFTFKFLNRDASSAKFLNIYAEDLKDVGIRMEIDQKDWAAWSRDMDEFNFDMTWAAWSSGLFKDPESMWHSREADRPSGNNITGFKSARVDELIDRQKSIFDVAARNAIYREIDALVAAEVPYALLWNINYVRLLYWNRFGTPDTVLSKYGDERAVQGYWWYDPDSASELEAAMKSGATLPPRPAEVHFDRVFRTSR